MSLYHMLASLIDTAGTGMLKLIGYAYRVTPDRVVIERQAVRIPDLPSHLDGFTIGVLSDLHLGPFLDQKDALAVTRLLAAEKPDLVVLAGDLVSCKQAMLALPRVLKPLRGAYAVLGNWEYGRDVVRPISALKQLRMLVNEGALVAEGLWLAGVDDAREAPDLDRALAGAPDGAVRILLSHEPDFADRVEARHRIALQISGHSHGGQVRLPLIGPTLLPPGGRKYHSGLNRAPHCQVYTSRGVGMVHLPIRLNCPPELSLLTLRIGRGLDGSTGEDAS